MEDTWITLEGNEAAANVAYALSFEQANYMKVLNAFDPYLR